jgi:hypothetical protein
VQQATDPGRGAAAPASDPGRGGNGAPRPQRGPGNGPWNGIALFDHPQNDGYPGPIGNYAVVQQITQAHYPPAGAPDGPFTFRHRVLVHDGDATAAGVGARAAEYGYDCEVEVNR